MVTMQGCKCPAGAQHWTLCLPTATEKTFHDKHCLFFQALRYTEAQKAWLLALFQIVLGRHLPQHLCVWLACLLSYYCRLLYAGRLC